MVHESLRKLAHVAQVPEEMVGVGQEHIPNIYIKKSANIGEHAVDSDRILETDFLRWVLLVGESHPTLLTLARQHIDLDTLHVPICKRIYQTYLDHIDHSRPCDFISLAIDVDDEEAQTLFAELLLKKINKDRAEQQVAETIQKILERNWMEKGRRSGAKFKVEPAPMTKP